MPAIQFSGLASGLDTTAIVNALVDVERIPVLRLQQQNANYSSQIGILDRLSSALATLRDQGNALDTSGEFLAYTGTVADDTIASVSASGDSVPGSYQLEVSALAQAQRTYSDQIADQTASLSTSDETLSLTIDGTQTDITVTAGSSLEEVAAAINGSGADVVAGIMFDGTNYRLQVVGNSTGADNAITFTDTGLGLNLEGSGNTVQAAQDASFTLDGFSITSEQNLVDGVLPGATLELSSTTTSATTITIEPDTSTIQSNLQSFVDAYNSVFTIINNQFGEGKGQETLNGDSTLRQIELGLSALVTSPISGLTTSDGDTMQLSDLGIESQNDGLLTLDTEKLDETLAAGFSDAATYFAGNASSSIDGMGQLLDDLIETYTDSVDGLLTTRRDGIQDQIDINDDRIEDLERYIEGFQTNLQRQYTELEGVMSALQSQQQYLAQFLQAG